MEHLLHYRPDIVKVADRYNALYNAKINNLQKCQKIIMHKQIALKIAEVRFGNTSLKI